MKQLLFIFLISFANSFIALAQPPYAACFNVDTKKGCAPLTVNITSCSQSGPLTTQPAPTYRYDFANNPIATGVQSTSFTYTLPGKYVIQQTVNDGAGAQNSITDTITVLGQPNPIFDVEVCTGRIGKVIITDTIYDTFFIDFGDGTNATVPLGSYNHNYSSVSNFTITVTGQYAIGCAGGSATKSITPFTTLTTPDFIDLTVNNKSTTTGTIAIRYDGTQNQNYRIEAKINNGGYAFVANTKAASTAIQTYSINNLNTIANTYTYRIQNFDVCGSSSSYSTEIASILSDATAQNGYNEITYGSNGGVVFSSINILRNNTPLQNNISSPFNDVSSKCSQNYCYQIEGATTTMSPATGQNRKSYSYENCVTATYNGAVPAVTNLNSTVEGTTVKLIWSAPTLNAASSPIAQYSIRYESNGSYQAFGVSNDTPYIDAQASVTTKANCYQISYTDPCNASITAPISLNTCTIFLTVERLEETNNLSWTPYVGYASGVKEYIIENLDQNGTVILSKSVGNVTNYSEIADQSLTQITYQIRAVPNATENLESRSNTVKLDLTPQLFMPTVFTPNNDGDNDVLELKGKYFKTAKVTILNKWGEVVFQTEDYTKSWDGTYRGRPATIDSYAYIVIAKDNTGAEVSIKGIVSLIR